MRNISAILFGVVFSLTAGAQAPKSPQELAAQVQTLIESKKTDRIAELIHPEVSAASVENFKSMLATYVGAKDLKVYPVPKDDKEAVRQFLAQSPVPGAVKPLEERVRTYAENGAHFAVEPLGDLVISVKRVGVSSEGSRSSVPYGKLDGKYFIVFAKRK